MTSVQDFSGYCRARFASVLVDLRERAIRGLIELVCNLEDVEFGVWLDTLPPDTLEAYDFYQLEELYCGGDPDRLYVDSCGHAAGDVQPGGAESAAPPEALSPERGPGEPPRSRRPRGSRAGRKHHRGSGG